MSKKVESKGRSPVSEINNRVAEVETLKLEGRSRGYIVNYSMDKWKVSDRTADEYIKKDTDRLKEINQESVQDTRAVVLANLWDLYRVSRNSDDIKEAGKTLMSIAKLTGLEESTINHVITDARNLEYVSDTELVLLMDKATSELA